MPGYGALASHYDVLTDDFDRDAWTRYLVELLTRADVAPGARIADAACGTGEMALRLYKIGYAVTALDNSPDMLEIAQDKLRRAGARVPVVLQDMRDMRLHSPADAVLCVCDGVNYLTDDSSLMRFLASARDALVPGGALLFDISSRGKLEKMDGQFYAEDRGEVAYIWNNAMAGGLLTMDLTLFERRGDGLYVRRDETHVQRAYRAETLLEALARAGFIRVEVFGFGTFGAPGADCQRLQFSAKKPQSDEKAWPKRRAENKI